MDKCYTEKLLELLVSLVSIILAVVIDKAVDELIAAGKRQAKNEFR